MLIRSQDKHRIINLNNIYGLSVEEKRSPSINGKLVDASSWYIDANCIIESSFHSCGIEEVYLGHYSTESKALKVLDMIQEKYSKTIDVGENGFLTAIYDYPKIFQMPQDEEVSNERSN